MLAMWPILTQLVAVYVQQAQPVMTVDDERAHGAFLGPGGTPQRRSVSPAQSPAGTVEHHALLYGLLGCLQASSQGGCAPAGHMQHVEDPTEASDVAHSDHTPDMQDAS